MNSNKCSSTSRKFKYKSHVMTVHKHLARPLMTAILFLAFTTKGSSTLLTTPALPQLDLSGYHLTFDESFKTLSISAGGPGTTWIAHTPWNGDFGNAAFGNPGPRGPFSLTAQGLAITARQNGDGKWHAGLICSRDKTGPDGAGFAQKYGYFEMKAKLPDGPGVWPAFWLVGTDTSAGTSELDVMEYYGHDNSSYRSTEHLWVGGKDTLHQGKKFDIVPGELTTGYNTFGVLITPAAVTYYFNRQPYWSTPTPPTYHQPMYLLANLAIGGGWPYDHLMSPKVMDIAYIHVYAKSP
jgi:beta-glucanase (GH16 family)